MGNIIVLSDYFHIEGEKRQKLQIQQSIKRLSDKPNDELSGGAIEAMVDFLAEKGIDTSKESFIQNMEAMKFLVKGSLEEDLALETDNTLMMGALRINIEAILEIEGNGTGQS